MMYNMIKKGISFFLCILMICSLIGSSAFAQEHEHSYSEVRIEPTCTTPGYMANVCGCGDYKDLTVLEPLGHDKGDAEGIVVQAPTAEAAGIMGY